MKSSEKGQRHDVLSFGIVWIMSDIARFKIFNSFSEMLYYVKFYFRKRLVSRSILFTTSSVFPIKKQDFIPIWEIQLIFVCMRRNKLKAILPIECFLNCLILMNISIFLFFFLEFYKLHFNVIYKHIHSDCTIYFLIILLKLLYSNFNIIYLPAKQ